MSTALSVNQRKPGRAVFLPVEPEPQLRPLYRRINQESLVFVINGEIPAGQRDTEAPFEGAAKRPEEPANRGRSPHPSLARRLQR